MEKGDRGEWRKVIHKAVESSSHLSHPHQISHPPLTLGDTGIREMNLPMDEFVFDD